jgi:hypothetical protein
VRADLRGRTNSVTLNIYLNNILAIRYTLIVSIIGIIYIYLVSLLTTTIIISFPSKIDNFIIKFIVIYSYGYISTSNFSISLYNTYYNSLFR